MLFVGDDWAEDHHDVELVDEGGRRLARARLPEGFNGVSRLHALIAEHRGEEWADLPAEEAPRRVVIGIETDHGPWVQALLAAGYVVFAINPMQVARYRERHSTSGAKSDAGDAHVLAEIVRLPPLEDARMAILELHLRGKPVDRLDLRKIARMTDGMSGAHLALICDDGAAWRW